MDTPRERRLSLELDRMQRLVLEVPYIAFMAQGAHPIEYGVILRCRGVESVEDDKAIYRDEHKFIIRLSPEFPLDAPLIRWETPLYHPNVVPPAVCLGDHWYPGWSLAEMCVALSEMVKYKTFNIYDPLNKEAASWIEKRIEMGESISLDEVDDGEESGFDINPIQRS